MALYDRPQFSQGEKADDTPRSKKSEGVFSVVVIAALVGFLAGGVPAGFAYWQVHQEVQRLQGNEASEQIIPGSETQEERVVQVVEQASPAVVSIVLTRDVPVFEQVYRDPFEEFFGEPSPFLIPERQQSGTEQQEVGQGSGFLVSADGMVVTNKHVVAEDDVEYTVFTNTGESYPAEVLARDPLQDVAFLQIESEESFPFIELGNSDSLQIGQTVIAIGNALGEFRNTVSMGVISGLGRTITASDGAGFVETIEDVIQTDAAINRGNSGGPLLNLSGQVIGINTATALQAQSIAFAVPANVANRDIRQLADLGRIVYPFLGVEYQLVTRQLQEEENLSVDYGAFIGNVVAGSAAQEAGIQQGDILLEFDGKRITQENSLGKIMQSYSEEEGGIVYSPGDQVSLKVLRDGQELTMQATLEEREE